MSAWELAVLRVMARPVFPKVVLVSLSARPPALRARPRRAAGWAIMLGPVAGSAPARGARPLDLRVAGRQDRRRDRRRSLPHERVARRDQGRRGGGLRR